MNKEKIELSPLVEIKGHPARWMYTIDDTEIHVYNVLINNKWKQRISKIKL